MINLLPSHLYFSILCFDLDETILNHSLKQKSDYIQKFNNFLNIRKKRGVILIYATARSRKDTIDAIKQYQLSEPNFLITDLGLEIFNYEKKYKEYDFKKSITNWDPKLIESVVSNFDQLKSRKPSRASFFKKTYYIDSDENHVINCLYKDLRKAKQKVVIYESGNKSIYIIPQGISKGKALSFLIKQLEIDKNDIVVAGDSPADYSLFKNFPHSILVGNASAIVKKVVSQTYPNVFLSKKEHTEGIVDGINYLNKLYHLNIFDNLNKILPLFKENKFNKIITKIKKQKKELKKITPKTKYIQSLILGHIYEKQGYFIKAKQEYVKSFKYSNKINDIYLKAIVNILLAKTNISLGNLKEGIDKLEDIKFLENKETYEDLNIFRLNALAYGYRIKGNFLLALETLKYTEKISKKSKLYTSVLHNMAGVYRDLKKYNLSLLLYKKILKLSDQNNLFFMARLYNNTGFIYRRLGEYPKAKKYYLKSYELEKQIGSKQLQSRTLNNLGGVSRMQSEYSKALTYFNRSVVLREKIKDKSGLSSSLLNKGIVLGELNKNREAKHFLNKSYNIRKDIGSKHLINEVLIELKKYD